MASKAWRCSQCGAVNEPGSRACHECGKWPSLFDLQDNVVEEPASEQVAQLEVGSFETEAFEPEVFEPELDDESLERRGRIPRWAITAVWVIGILVWILVNALGDRS